jgi:hypothetical protein
LEVKNPLEESKVHSKNKRKQANNNEEDCEEIMDDDEDILNRRLPLNSNNH